MRSKFKWIFTLLLAFTMQFSFAQEKTVTGVVSDATGPLPGANVVVKGTTRSAQTDFDGKYSVKAKQGETLVFSFTGYNEYSVVVGAGNTYNAKLQENVKTLNEVVVVGCQDVLGVAVQVCRHFHVPVETRPVTLSELQLDQAFSLLEGCPESEDPAVIDSWLRLTPWERAARSFDMADGNLAEIGRKRSRHHRHSVPMNQHARGRFAVKRVPEAIDEPSEKSI